MSKIVKALEKARSKKELQLDIEETPVSVHKTIPASEKSVSSKRKILPIPEPRLSHPKHYYRKATGF